MKSQPVHVFGYNLNNHSQPTQLLICIGGTFIFFLGYAFIQEFLFKIDGFEFGWFLTLVQFAIYAALAGLSKLKSKEKARRAPLKNYFILSCFMVITMGLSNVACIYLNYPTQVLFKSCKLIPVMIGGRFILQRSYTLLEYVSSILLCMGLCVLTLANKYIDAFSFDPRGVLLISGALIGDAFIGNLQEKTMRTYNVHQRELVYYSYTIGCGYLLFISLITGELISALQFCAQNPMTYYWMTLFSLLGYIGIIFVLAMIKVFGAFIAMTVTSCRKVTTIALSFVLFPKPLTIQYIIAACLVFFGISVHIYSKNRRVVLKLLYHKDLKEFTLTKPNPIELPISASSNHEPSKETAISAQVLVL